ncbi:DoxX family protein [Pseudonocardia spinosispora]|uniref:DoxX family protein n=1 Tax=Pseudonocardia spinosispora TaxID=103441 RepID=UPI001FE03AE4|nr:DoxX family protein [Pseudonocardia spinosispora]
MTIFAIVANFFSGAGAIFRLKPILPAMARAGVPASWLPVIGALKLAGAVGLLVGLLWLPWVGVAAAVGLVLYFVCAVHTHLLARDYSSQFYLALFFLALASVTLGVQVVSS